jgi:Rps23 Pro-64 3,4-dihydroxylase Tpa1-like proline 4-hydroxylase
LTDQTTTTVLDHVLDTLRTTTLRPDPWPHCYLENALPGTIAAEIESSFDRIGLAPVAATNREKTYRMHTRRVDLTSDVRLPSPAWRQLVEALRDQRYRAALGELTGVALADTKLTIDLWEYRAGDWLAPHVDKPEKVVTQLFYFSKDWRPDVGGHLLVLDSADAPERPRRRLRPVTGASAVLVRSASSWHAVESTRGSGTSRCSVAVTFWRQDESTGETDA